MVTGVVVSEIASRSAQGVMCVAYVRKNRASGGFWWSPFPPLRAWSKLRPGSEVRSYVLPDLYYPTCDQAVSCKAISVNNQPSLTYVTS